MNKDTEFGYKMRQALNQGLDKLGEKVSERLHSDRQAALTHQRVVTRKSRFAGVGIAIETVAFVASSNVRTLLAIMALSVGAMGSYYWNALAQVRENAAIDSALLADELPPSAYLDRGFHAWLERASDSSSQ